MTGAELLALADELDAYYRAFDGCVVRREARKWLRVYARGQLGPIERKSLEPIADAEGVAPRTLQWFFMRNGWDEDQVLAVHQRRVGGELSGADGVFVIDETSDAKKGEWTAGVARQYCGESGKLDNGIVSVHLAYVREDWHALLDGELFLPERWNPDSDDPRIALKRRRAQLPPDALHRPKTVMALGSWIGRGPMAWRGATSRLTSSTAGRRGGGRLDLRRRSAVPGAGLARRGRWPGPLTAGAGGPPSTPAQWRQKTLHDSRDR